MKWKGLVWAIVLVLTAAGAAWGDIYQYTDESGVVRFTDDPSLIPDDQRPNVQTMESVKSAYHAETAPVKSLPPGVETPADEVRVEAKELDAMNAELLREYNALQAEKEALGPPPSQTAKTRERADYDEKVIEFNRKNEAYRQRVQEFDEKVKTFNSRITGK